MKIPHPVHKLNPYNYTDQHITHATQKANKVARRSKKTRGTNVAGMAKPKPETLYAYLNFKGSFVHERVRYSWGTTI